MILNLLLTVLAASGLSLLQIPYPNGASLSSETVSAPKSIEVKMDPSMAPESYILEVGTDGRVCVTAADAAGAFYAQQTMDRQLAAGGLAVGTIKDAPRFSWRGFMLDEARHFFGMEKVKWLLDEMARLKLNRFHWHLTDAQGWRIEIKAYPDLARVGGRGTHSDIDAPAQYYTQEQIREIVEYAAQRHIQIIPEIDMPGHASAACKAYPEYSGGGVSAGFPDFTFNVGKPETYAFLTQILREVAALFPSPWIMIGGDEVSYGSYAWLADKDIKALMDSQGYSEAAQAEGYFIRAMADSVKALGKQMIGWDDIVDFGVDPENNMMMWWRHDNVQRLHDVLDGGFRTVLCPRKPMYFDFVQREEDSVGRRWDGFCPLEDVYSFPDAWIETWGVSPQQLDSQVIGIQSNLWTELVHNDERLEYMVFPRLMATAEAAWTLPQNKDYARFCRALEKEYGRPDRAEPAGPVLGERPVDRPCVSLEDGTASLRGTRVQMSFKAEGPQWALTSYLQDGEQLCQGVSNTEPWKLTLLGPKGETPTLTPRLAKYRGASLGEDGRSLVFEWTIFLENEDKWPVRATVRLPEAGSELSQWSLSAQLPKGWVISQLEYPCISVSRHEGSKGIMSVGYGAEYPLGDSGMISSTYPSCTGAMQLILSHSPKGCFYLSADDRNGGAKWLQIRCSSSALTFVQKLDTSFGWTDAKGNFELPWNALFGFNPGTWEETVLRWYRPFALSCRWGEKSILERDITPWMLNADVWIRPQDVNEEQMEGVRKAIAAFGKDLGIHWYYWHEHPHDVLYPDYFPAQDGFKDYVAEAQSLGAHVTPYTNGRLWDPATKEYKKLSGAKASCRRLDGKLYTEVYSSRAVNTVTCPASPIWQKIQMNISKTLLEEYKTDGVYIDQVGAAASMPCYATNHGHAPGAGCWWPEAYRDLLTRMRAELYSPNQAMTTEENAECYIDLFDMMLVVNGPHTPTVHMVPLFPLVYSDRCVYSGYTYIPWKLSNGSCNFIQMKSLLWGSQLCWINPVLLFSPGNEVEVQFIKTLGEFRKANHDIFVGGRFMGEFIPTGEAQAEVDVPGYYRTAVVQGARWLTVDGKEAIVLVNMNKWSRKVTLPDGREVLVPGYGVIRL